MGIHKYENQPRETITLHPKEIIYAGQSNRRQLFLSYCFPSIPISNIPSGPEEDTPNVSQIMHGKLTTVWSQILSKEDHRLGNQVIIVAADTRTSTLMSDDWGNFALISRGKPVTRDEVKETFVRMKHANQKARVLPGYFVLSASGYLIVESGQRLDAQSITTVVLKPEFVSHLSSDKGSEDYVTRYLQFYSGSAYTNQGLPPITITDISGGLSLPVLAQIGAILHINEIPTDDPRYPNVLKHAIYNVAVGFAPQVLSLFDPTIEQRIESWPWLKQITYQCLQGKL